MATTIYNDFQGGYYMTTPDQDSSYATMAAQAAAPTEMGVIDKEHHMSTSDLYGVQKAEFVATIRGSLEYFQNNPEKAVFQPPPEMHRFLQKVTDQQNRSKAGSVVGDLGRTILLKAVITEQRNTFNKDMGVDIQGLVPTQFTAHGRHNHVVFANTAPQVINKDIFEPESIFTKPDYIKYGKLTTEGLKKEIQFPEHEPNTATIKVGGIAWDLLLKNAREGNFSDEVQDQLQALVQENLTVNPLMRNITVDAPIGRALYDAISEPLSQLDKQFVDLRRTQTRFLPADGQGWTSFDSLVGQAAGQNAVDNNTLSSYELTKVCECSVKVEYHYVSF